MPDTQNPSAASSSRFGWPKPKRTEEFTNLLAKPSGATERVVFQGQTIDIPIIRVPIDLPKYRMVNGRTASLQAEYLAKNPKARADLFSGDPELIFLASLKIQLTSKLTPSFWMKMALL